MNLEWNLKLLVSCGTLLLNPKSNWSIANCHQNFTRTFIIARHLCHKCINILVTIIFAVVACTINFFIKTYFIFPFIIIFWWLWKIFDHVIFRSTSKAFPRRTFCSSIVRSINHARFLLFLSYPFETFFCRVICTSTTVHFFWTSCAFSLFLPKTQADVNIKAISMQGWNVQWFLICKCFFFP